MRTLSPARKAHAKVGLCGQAPSDHPEFAEFLVACGIDSISVSPDSFVAVKQRRGSEGGTVIQERQPGLPARSVSLLVDRLHVTLLGGNGLTEILEGQIAGFHYSKYLITPD